MPVAMSLFPAVMGPIKVSPLRVIGALAYPQWFDVNDRSSLHLAI